jgi:hypothetical protein
MNLTNKLKQKAKLALTGLVTLATIALTPKTAVADFYDGVRGPSKAQVHYTLANGDDHSLALKYFGKDVFAIGVANANSNGVQGYIGGLGLIVEGLERVKAIPVLGYGLSPNGEQGTAVGVAQATVFVDKDGTFLLDPRYVVAVPAHGQEDHTPQHTLGLTASVGDSQVRIGVDIQKQLGQDTVLGILARYDIDAENHSSWVEFGVGQTGAQLQFRGNF